MISFLPPARDLQGRTGFELLGESYRPNTSTVLSAGFRSALEGPGSAIQDIEAGTIASETGNREGLGYFQPLSEALNFALFGALTPDEVGRVESQPLDEEAWKASEYYREGLPYQEGMTTLAASILANSHDRQAERDFILSKASNAQTVGAFAAGLVGGFADVKQLPVNVAAAAAVPFTAGLGIGIRAGIATDVGVTGLVTGATSAGLRAIQASRAARVSAVLAEATVSTIPTVETALANADITGREYTAGDAAFDFLVSAGLSAGIQVGGEAIGAAWRRYGNSKKAADVGRVATHQAAAGEKIDVGPLVRAGVADFTPDFYRPVVVPIRGGGGWIAKFGEKQGLVGEPIKVTAATREEAAALAEDQFISRMAGQAETPEARNLILMNLEAKRRVAGYNRNAEAAKLVDRTVEVRAAREELSAAEKALGDTPGRRARLEPLQKYKDQVADLEARVRANPREFAAFDDRVLNAEKELAAAKKALSKAGDGGKRGARERAVLEAEDNLDFAVERATVNIDDLLNIIPEYRGLKKRIEETTPQVDGPGIKLGKRETRKLKDVETARAKLDAAIEAVRPKVLEKLNADKARLDDLLVRSDKAIRDIQSREAAKRLPNYVKKQLDTSVEARAERSIDPRAVEVEQDKLEPVSYDNDAPAKPLTPEELTELQTLAIDDPVVKGYLAEWEKLQKFPDYVRNYAKCKAGL